MKKITIYAICLFLSVIMTFSPFRTAAEPVSRSGILVASFYPIYILSLNVFRDIPELEVKCMTAPDTGCLHDYQLLIGDMMMLSDADALIVCGAGMETYLADVMKQFPDLPVIDCSTGIDLLSDADTGEIERSDINSYNAHTWLDAANAVKIVNTIALETANIYPEYKETILSNTASYTDRLSALDRELREMLAPVQNKSIVTFHEAFPYFARAYGLKISAVITEEHEEALSPVKLAEVVKTVESAGCPPLFTEPQYSAAAAYAVAAETGSSVYELDPLTTGEYDPDAYEKIMLKNAGTILKALSDREQ